MNNEKMKKDFEELVLLANELRPNDSKTSYSSLRQMAQVSGGYNQADTLHSIYLDYGYPSEVSFFNLWNMYRRFGIAKNVIELPVGTCWSTPPTIESSTEFLNSLKRLDKRVKIWQRIKGLDIRQRVGRYAGMFMRVRDNKDPSQPIEGKLGSEAGLMDMIPLYESQLEVIDTDTDAMSETFGQPILLQYNQSAIGNRNEEVASTIQIHASRIVFAAEGADNGWIYGIPAMEPVFNSLMDLCKIIGGGAEGFYKNAAQSIVFDLKDSANALAYKDKLDSFSENYDEFSKSRFRRGMWTPGMEANTLESTLVQPQEFFNIALNDVAAGSSIPATILIGQQTGRLASDEDNEHYLSVNQSRRGNFCTELTTDVLDWCIRYGILPLSGYEVVWDDLLARSEKEKLENADQMSAVNEKQFKSGGEIPFSGNEIREAAGYESTKEDFSEPEGEIIELEGE